MPENLEKYTPPEIATQIDTSLEPPKKISPEIKPDKNISVPETPPIVQTEVPQTENPAEKKPQIDLEVLSKAKKHLEELYGPDSKIDVGADVGIDTPEKFYNIETAEEKNIPEQVGPIDIEKSIPIEKIEPQENVQQKTPEQLEDKKRVAEELNKKQIENAILELEAKLKIIDESREKKDRVAEHSNLKEARMPFEIAEGRGLVKKAIEMADVELKQERLVRLSPEQYREKFIKRAEGDAEETKKSDILEARFATLSNQEKAQYAGTDGMNKFSVDINAKINNKIEELAKKGITISQNAFYAMMDKGLNPEQIKVGGWFSNKIKVPYMPLLAGKKPSSEAFSKENLMNLISGLESGFNQSIKNQAGATIEREIKRGQDIWKAKKNKCMRDVIKNTVDNYKKQQEEVKHQQEIEEQKKIADQEEQQKIEEEKSKKKSRIKKTTAKKAPRKKVEKKDI